ncbi:MAG: amino acid racemase [Desulfobacterales bacterium]|nr:amino acid racemase [Desulfobacterales bacterium]MDH4010715.1 amino acid racemase [Desulfobacterales bacterium]
MKEKTIGILGGMGPEATLDCYSRIISSTPAKTDQEHLRVIIDSNPKVPDRTAAIIAAGQSPVPVLVAGCRALQQAGADFIIIPCVSAHFFLDEIQQQIALPILSIFDVVTETIISDHPQIKTVGLMGTTGTINCGLFQKRLAVKGIETRVADETQQSKVMEAIYDIKNSQPARPRTQITSDLVAVADGLISMGARGIIAGCTEIPLVLKQEHLSVPYFDALTILARAAIFKAGLTPIP